MTHAEADADRHASWASSARKCSRWRRGLRRQRHRRSIRRRATRNRCTPIAYLTDADDEPMQDPRARRDRANRSIGLAARDGEAGRAAAGASSKRRWLRRTTIRRRCRELGERVWRLRRADPPDREQGAQDDARADGARCNNRALARLRRRPPGRRLFGRRARLTARPAFPARRRDWLESGRTRTPSIAFFDIDTKSFSRHSAMPGVDGRDQRLARHEERRFHHVEREAAVRPHSSSSAGTSGSSVKP